jgi:hypothetical protein
MVPLHSHHHPPALGMCPKCPTCKPLPWGVLWGRRDRKRTPTLHANHHEDNRPLMPTHKAPHPMDLILAALIVLLIWDCLTL